jgi:hypothetical protein
VQALASRILCRWQHGHGGRRQMAQGSVERVPQVYLSNPSLRCRGNDRANSTPSHDERIMAGLKLSDLRRLWRTIPVHHDPVTILQQRFISQLQHQALCVIQMPLVQGDLQTPLCTRI